MSSDKSNICYVEKLSIPRVGSAPDASAAMLMEVQPSLVAMSQNGHAGGSGWVIDDNDHVATDMHVALRGRQLEVMTPTGHTFNAYIEKLDVPADVAVLKVPGLSKSGMHAAKIDSGHQAAVGEKVFAAGSPLVIPKEVAFSCVSEGQILARTSRREFEAEGKAELARQNKTVPFPELPAIDAFIDVFKYNFGSEVSDVIQNNQDKFVPAANDWQTMQTIISSSPVEQGQSGGVLYSALGVEGMLESGDNQGTLATPAKRVTDLAKRPSRFYFTYGNDHRLLSISAANGGDTEGIVEAGLAQEILNKSQN